MPSRPPSKRWSSMTMVIVAGGAGVLGFLARPFLSAPPISASVRALPGARIALGSVAPRAESLAPEKIIGGRDAAFWLTLCAQPRSQQSASAMAAWLEKMAEDDPAAALRLALAEENGKVRDTLRDAVLRAWSKSAPEAAAAWALHQPAMDDRLAAMNAVFEGAAMRDPRLAVTLARKLYAETPALTFDYGNIAISMLAKYGAYEAAMQFALRADGNSAQGSWINSAFSAWAQYQPQQAASAWLGVANPELRREAFLGLIAGWTAADPAGLAVYAQALPPGENRTEAMQTSLLRWVSVDPVKASAWVDSLEPGPEVDLAAAAVASIPSLIRAHPDTALSWATSITNPETRASTLRELATQLSRLDIGAARRVLASATFLNPADRAAFSEGVTAPPTFE